MSRIEIYTKNWCAYCHRAKALLASSGLDFLEYDVTDDRETEEDMRQRSGRTSVPQVFINGIHLGGSDDLTQAIRQGDLSEAEILSKRKLTSIG